MGSTPHPNDWLATSLRWMARGTSIFVGGMISVSVIGGLASETGLTTVTSIQLILSVGVGIGFLLAWRWQGVGGVASVASLIASIALTLGSGQSHPELSEFAVMAVPGLLFLGSWLWARRVAARAE